MVVPVLYRVFKIIALANNAAAVLLMDAVLSFLVYEVFWMFIKEHLVGFESLLVVLVFSSVLWWPVSQISD